VEAAVPCWVAVIGAKSMSAVVRLG